MYSVQCAVCSVQCTMYSVQCALCSVQCAVYSVQCGVWSVECAVCSVQYGSKDGKYNMQIEWLGVFAVCSELCALCSV